MQSDTLSPEGAVQQALELVTADRQNLYGHPADDFSKVALIWSAIFGVDVEAWQVPLALVGVKISRELNARKEDNLVDMLGYILTLVMIYQEGLRLTQEEEAELSAMIKEAIYGNHTEENRGVADVQQDDCLAPSSCKCN